MRSVVMNILPKYAKIVNNLMLDELDHILHFDLFEWDNFNPLRKIIDNCKNELMTFWWWLVNWHDDINAPHFEWL